MRILKLHMKNFAPIYYSLDKTEVTLDYTSEELKSKVIYIFVGQMGSCKTFLLAHHTPFSTLGTLDIRNGEDMILDGKRGLKEISYMHGENLYEIQHLYIPNKNTHMTKSYMKKNGTELNPNGNTNTFRELVEAEFGLDQNYLKLFRIGSNVINLLDMSPAERKSFISSMLSETEIYLMLHKRISDRQRAMNAQLTMLLNRIRAISDKSEEELQKDLDTEQKILDETNAKYGATLKESYYLEAQMKSRLGKETLDEMRARRDKTKQLLDEIRAEIASIQETLDEIKEMPNLNKLMAKITTIQAKQEMRHASITELASNVDRLADELNSVKDKLAMLASEEHVEEVRKTYNELMVTLKDYEKRLKYFTYEGTLAAVDGFLSELHTMDGLIANVAQYNAEALHAIFHNSQKAINQAKKEIDYLWGQKRKLSAEMDHVSRASTYEATHVMMRPFDCPTKDCPYFQYHPYTEAKKHSTHELDKRFMEHRSAIQAVDVKIAHYESFPMIANRVEDLKRVWKRVYQQANDLDVALEDDLEEIVTNPTKRNWWSQTKLDKIRELCGIREKYYELMQQVMSMKNDLAIYELSDRASLEKSKAKLEKDYDSARTKLETAEATYREQDDELRTLQDLFTKISSIEEMKLALKGQQSQEHEYQAAYDDLTTRIAACEELDTKLKAISGQLIEQKNQYSLYEKSVNELRRKINDIHYTKEQYDETVTQQDIYKAIVDALSSKNGIPLAFVRLFLSECKDTINDLISDVFADHLEIQNFDIPDNGTEFNIPYTKNGLLISDVSKASQGERAIISLAISFALIRQRSFDYNIMLLDEMDGPLYKEDRNKFIDILMKQIRIMSSEQVFLVSHNNTFDGYNVCIIMTTEEIVDESPLTTTIRI